MPRLVFTYFIEESSLAKRVFCLGSHIEVNENPNARRPSFVRSQSGNDKITYEEGTWISQMIRKHYAPFLMKNSTRFAVLFIYLGYLAISIYGCCILRQGLEPSKLLVEDSYARKYSKNIEKYFWSQGILYFFAEIFVHEVASKMIASFFQVFNLKLFSKM